MINCNPETVSTDYDISDRLYFEPLTLEDVLAVCEAERLGAFERNGSAGADGRRRLEGIVVQFGGQTPLKLAAGLPRGRRAHPRHQRGGDRPGRGPLTLWAAARPAGF